MGKSYDPIDEQQKKWKTTFSRASLYERIYKRILEHCGFHVIHLERQPGRPDCGDLQTVVPCRGGKQTQIIDVKENRYWRHDKPFPYPDTYLTQAHNLEDWWWYVVFNTPATRYLVFKPEHIPETEYLCRDTQHPVAKYAQHSLSVPVRYAKALTVPPQIRQEFPLPG